jgi:hypothetical protein
VKDFNPDNEEIPVESVRILSFRPGELVLVTMPANKHGWFEGFRANDPENICGIAHISSVKKVNFS